MFRPEGGNPPQDSFVVGATAGSEHMNRHRPSGRDFTPKQFLVLVRSCIR